MKVPHAKNKLFKITDREAMYENSPNILKDAASTFFEVWGEHSVPRLMKINDYNKYDYELLYKVTYKHVNGEETTGYINHSTIKKLERNDLLEDGGYE